MAWQIEKRDGCVVTRMNSNPVNKMNRGFFRDLHAFVDTVEREYRDSPVVLTSASEKAFCAGLDFDAVFPIFSASDPQVIREFFGEFRRVYLRLFQLSNPLIAAVNGPAIAGGFILLCCCEQRLAARGRTHFAVNEVPLGVAMPSAFTEIIRHTLGNRVTESLVLRGHTVSGDEALTAGITDELVPAEQLLERAVSRAGAINRDSLTAYRYSKAVGRQPTLERIANLSNRLDEALVEALSSPDSRRAREKAYQGLRGRRRG